MTITLGSINTGSHLHGTIESQPFDADVVRQQFFGVKGEFYLLGTGHGRDMSCWLLLHGYASHAAVQTGVDTLNSLQNSNGTMTWTLNGDVRTFTNTLFLGFTPDEPPWLDGSGVHGWQVRGMMKFRQVFS